MNEQEKYNTIEKAYENIKNIISSNSYNYVQVIDNNINPIRIGSIANDEYGFGTRALDAYLEWDYEDTAENCFRNIHNMTANILADENTRINSEEIEKTNGLIKKVESDKVYNPSKVDFFVDKKFNSYVENFQNGLEANSVAEYFGYFTPKESGEHTFRLGSFSSYQLWISNNHALYDFKQENADIDSSRGSMMNDNYFKINLQKNVYYPIRFIVLNDSSNIINGPLLRINSPSGNVIMNNTNDFKYFISLMESGKPYYKKVVYFGFVQHKNIDKNEPKFKCFIMDLTKDNYNTILKLKTNKPLVYYHTEVPTTLTYESAVYNKSASRDATLKIDTPAGADLNITKAKWGMDYDRKEDHGEHIWIDKTKHSEIHNKIYYTVKQPYSNPAKWNHRGDGFRIIQFKGYWGGNHGHFNLANRIRDWTAWNPDLENVPQNHSYIMEAKLRHRHSGHHNFWGVMRFTRILLSIQSDDYAEIYINDRLFHKSHCCGKWSQQGVGPGGSGGHYDMWNHDRGEGLRYKDIHKIKILYGNGGGPGYFRMRMRDYRPDHGAHRQRRRRSRSSYGIWQVHGETQISSQYHTHHDFKEEYARTSYRDVTKHRWEKIAPTPQKRVWKANWVTLPSSFDVQAKTDGEVKGNELEVVPSYDKKYGDPAPGWDKDKNLRVEYGYTQVFDANDPKKQITKKNIYLDDTGKLVFGYDFNNTTNKSTISFLKDSDLCSESKHCKYSLVIEDDGSISIYTNSNRNIWNRQILSENLNRDDIVSVERWLKNPQRRNFLNVNQKLSVEDVPEIVSENGKYKLSFVDGKLQVTYGKYAYSKVKSGNNDIYYTTSKHMNGNFQIYHLYTLSTHELHGKKFLARIDNTNQEKTLSFLPREYSNVLQFDKYESTGSAFPLLKNSEYEQLSKGETGTTISNKYKLFNIEEKNEEECEAYCKNDVECEHFFFMNTRTGAKCLQDITSNSVPIYTTKIPHDNILESKMNKKEYSIKTFCGDVQRDQLLSKKQPSEFSNYKVAYNTVLENDPSKTFYCGDDEYKKQNDIINTIYKSKTEGFTANCGTSGCIVENKIPHLNKTASKLSNKQKKVSFQQDRLAKSYDELSDKVDTINLNPKYNNDGIPNKFKDVPNSSRPEVTKEEAMLEDSKHLLIQENTMYTIGTISLATILISAIILARE